jgi:hypothetical protein
VEAEEHLGIEEVVVWHEQLQMQRLLAIMLTCQERRCWWISSHLMTCGWDQDS